MEDGKRMAADGNLLQGQVNEDPTTEKRNVDGLIQGFLRALIAEQGGARKIAPAALAHDSKTEHHA